LLPVSEQRTVRIGNAETACSNKRIGDQTCPSRAENPNTPFVARGPVTTLHIHHQPQILLNHTRLVRMPASSEMSLQSAKSYRYIADNSRGVAQITINLSFGFSCYETSNNGANSTYSALPKRLFGSEHLVLHVAPTRNQ
jgi:hypothetical protein